MGSQGAQDIPAGGGLVSAGGSSSSLRNAFPVTEAPDHGVVHAFKPDRSPAAENLCLSGLPQPTRAAHTLILLPPPAAVWLPHEQDSPQHGRQAPGRGPGSTTHPCRHHPPWAGECVGNM